MVGLYHIVVIGCHMITLTFATPLLEASDPSVSHTALIYHLWVIHTVVYIILSNANPGVVTAHNLQK